jgi:hypothetical protein
MTSKEKAEERYGNMPFGIGVERRSIFISGAKWQEDNSDKKYTEEDLRKAFKYGIEMEAGIESFDYKNYPDGFSQFINSLNKKSYEK